MDDLVVIVGIVMAAVILGLAWLLGRRRPDWYKTRNKVLHETLKEKDSEIRRLRESLDCRDPLMMFGLDPSMQKEIARKVEMLGAAYVLECDIPPTEAVYVVRALPDDSGVEFSFRRREA